MKIELQMEITRQMALLLARCHFYFKEKVLIMSEVLILLIESVSLQSSI